MIADSQQLQADVLQRVTDWVLLQATVYSNRVCDSVEVKATVVPLLASVVQLRATVINQDFEAAAAGQVLAPQAEITFLSA
jgi:hypothetical protein